MIDRIVKTFVAVVILLVAIRVVVAFCGAVDDAAGKIAVSLGLPYVVGSFGWHFIPGVGGAAIAAAFVPRAQWKLLTMVFGGAFLGLLFSLVC